MDLTSVAQPAHGTIRGIKFSMRDGPTLVSILVAHSVLQSIEKSPPGTGDYLARFQKHRERLEQIASSKHARGLIEENGSVIVHQSDLQGF